MFHGAPVTYGLPTQVADSEAGQFPHNWSFNLAGWLLRTTWLFTSTQKQVFYLHPEAGLYISISATWLTMEKQVVFLAKR